MVEANLTDAPADAVVTVYNEPVAHINITLRSLLAQEQPFGCIWLVDDGSAQPVALLPGLIRHPSIHHLRHEPNQGISASRNRGIRLSNASFIACINAETDLDPRWLLTLLAELRDEKSGCAFTRLVPARRRFTSAWRFRFHEQKYPATPGPYFFAPGHAVLFRRSTLLQVGLYNEKLRKVEEDYDISWRLQQAGYACWYNPAPFTLSHQHDSLPELARKHMMRLVGNRQHHLSARQFFPIWWRDAVQRTGRNFIKMRWHLLPVDIWVMAGVWWYFLQQKHT